MNRGQGESGWVLGGSGFLGAHVVRVASLRGARVLNVCRNPGAAPAFARDVAEARAVDLTRESELLALFQCEPPAWIVNCTASANAAECERAPDVAQRLNRDLPARLAGWCSERDVRLLHVSTDLVFDGEGQRAGGYVESDSARPGSEYGRSKLAGEARVLVAAPAALVVRLPLLYGDSGGRGLGASDALLSSLQAGQTSRLFTDELRTPLDVEEAAMALLELVRMDCRGLLHVAGPRSISRYELGLLVVRASGLSSQAAERQLVPVLRADLRLSPPRPRDVSLNTARAKTLLATTLSPPEDRLSSRAS